MKAGKVASGEFATEKVVKHGLAHFIVIAKDASDNTKKKFRNMCAYYRVPFRCFFSKDELGRAIGKEYRSCLAVLEENLARTLEKQLNEQLEK
ncbi:MAG: ribosomal L7Ae/L30e/S12e/Gadd45 family protein [Lachnospiraceae bacterium]|nr:ribosomal L7Ae/L30e/S12e/Gadd45 family protein [Lachnospiraceae bacterium]